MPDRNLMDFAMEKYGSFNLPKGLPKEKWRGNHIWDLNLELVEYIVTDIHDGHVEIIDIVNKLYLPTIENYNEKVGEVARLWTIIFSLFLITSLSEVNAKNPPPGTGTTDIPANILIMLDNSGSMSGKISWCSSDSLSC